MRIPVLLRRLDLSLARSSVRVDGDCEGRRASLDLAISLLIGPKSPQGKRLLWAARPREK